ncbi:putative pollen-specific leucine-rich repeat extensin-like protein 3 [Iris pallida]|uniref:Pollen-specific leucine-rich repeat extensin-like protein 3 n=1 Tax=Iris pallida TaxID=29817 RepID=A0AAX6G9Z5_IRIPA|nr:putative pollen-specific leucine-rich repeat extensin-like protein 3 [Iris pallida]
MDHRKCLAPEPYTLCTSERGSHRRTGGSGRRTALKELRSWLLVGLARRRRSASGGANLRPTDGKRRSTSFKSSRLGGGLAPDGGDRLPGELRDGALERRSRWPQVAQARTTEERGPAPRRGSKLWRSGRRCRWSARHWPRSLRARACSMWRLPRRFSKREGRFGAGRAWHHVGSGLPGKDGGEGRWRWGYYCCRWW